YYDTTASAADIDKFLRVEWSSDDADSWQPLAELRLADLAETVIDLPLPQQLAQGFEEIAVRLTPLSIGDNSASLAIDSAGLTYNVGRPARLDLDALDAGQKEDNLPVFIATQDLSVRIELDSPITRVAQCLARNLPGTSDNPPEAEIKA